MRSMQGQMGQQQPMGGMMGQQQPMRPGPMMGNGMGGQGQMMGNGMGGPMMGQGMMGQPNGMMGQPKARLGEDAMAKGGEVGGKRDKHINRCTRTVAGGAAATRTHKRKEGPMQLMIPPPAMLGLDG